MFCIGSVYAEPVCVRSFCEPSEQQLLVTVTLMMLVAMTRVRVVMDGCLPLV